MKFLTNLEMRFDTLHFLFTIYSLEMSERGAEFLPLSMKHSLFQDKTANRKSFDTKDISKFVKKIVSPVVVLKIPAKIANWN